MGTTRRRVQVNAEVPAEQVDFLEEALGFSRIAHPVRAVVATVATLGHLPAPVVKRLRRDALALNLNALEYIQLALHQRYRQLVAQDRAKKRARRPTQ